MARKRLRLSMEGAFRELEDAILAHIYPQIEIERLRTENERLKSMILDQRDASS